MKKYNETQRRKAELTKDIYKNKGGMSWSTIVAFAIVWGMVLIVAAILLIGTAAVSGF